MKASGWVRRYIVCLLLPTALATLPARAAGFGIFEQGNKATGMANAFTAQADDPSAMFYNVGGLAFQDRRDFMAGLTVIFFGDSSFAGSAPFPGPTYFGAQTDQLVTPLHFYWVEPLGDRLTFGVGVEMPFGLITEWQDPDYWAGRYISVKADLRTADINPSIGWQITDRLGIGAGVVLRASTVDLERRVPAINPFTLSVADVASIDLSSDTETGFGWNLGLLHRVTDRLSWGLSYRSAVTVDYGGDAELTQIETGFSEFDEFVAGTLPFGRALPIRTSVEFPDMASLGLAYRIGPSLLIEADFNWAGWSTFDRTSIEFTENPEFSSEIASEWEDSNNYRFGLLWDVRGPGEWRFGAYYDETPQPDASVGPLLPDADRVGFSAGYGRPLGEKTYFDIAVMRINFDERTTTSNREGFYGTYDTSVWLLGASIGW